MLSLFLGVVAASEVCEQAPQELGIATEDCNAIEAEYIAMVDSGKSVEQLETELAQCGDEAPMDAPDTDLTCNAACNAGSSQCNNCMQIRQMDSSCKLDTPGCARQVAYGGYVKSHVLIQCYGVIQEGCKRLPTIYRDAQVSKASTGKAPAKDSWPTCDEMCAAGCKSNSCSNNCSCGNEFLNKPMMGTSAHDTPGCGSSCGSCMTANFPKYLKCVGRRVSKCYRQKWTVTRQCENAAPTEWGGCTQSWQQAYDCQGSGCSSGCGSSGCSSGCGSGSCLI